MSRATGIRLDGKQYLLSNEHDSYVVTDVPAHPDSDQRMERRVHYSDFKKGILKRRTATLAADSSIYSINLFNRIESAGEGLWFAWGLDTRMGDRVFGQRATTNLQVVGPNAGLQSDPLFMGDASKCSYVVCKQHVYYVDRITNPSIPALRLVKDFTLNPNATTVSPAVQVTDVTAYAGQLYIATCQLTNGVPDFSMPQVEWVWDQSYRGTTYGTTTANSTSTTLTDTGAAFLTDPVTQASFTYPQIINGSSIVYAANGAYGTITSYTNTVLTVASWTGTPPPAATKYVISSGNYFVTQDGSWTNPPLQLATPLWATHWLGSSDGHVTGSLAVPVTGSSTTITLGEIIAAPWPAITADSTAGDFTIQVGSELIVVRNIGIISPATVANQFKIITRGAQSTIAEDHQVGVVVTYDPGILVQVGNNNGAGVPAGAKAGSTRYSYYVVARTAANSSSPTPVESITIGPDSLSAGLIAGVRLRWKTGVGDGTKTSRTVPASFDVYRSYYGATDLSSAQNGVGLIQNVLNDTNAFRYESKTFSYSYIGAASVMTATTLTDSSSNFSIYLVGSTITDGLTSAVITAVTSPTVLAFSGGWTGGTPANGTGYTITGPTNSYNYLVDIGAVPAIPTAPQIAPQFVIGDTGKAAAFLVIRDKIWRAAGGTMWSWDGRAGTWSGAAPIGDPNTNITALDVYQDGLIIFKQDGIYSMDRTGLNIFPLFPGFRTLGFNPRPLGQWQDSYFFASDVGMVWQWNGSTVKSIGFDNAEAYPFPDGTYGLPNAVTRGMALPNFFLVGFNKFNSTANGAFFFAYDGMAWHPFHYDSQYQAVGLGVTGGGPVDVPSNPILQFGKTIYGGGPSKISSMSSPTLDPFLATSYDTSLQTLFLPVDQGIISDEWKVFEGIRLYVENPTYGKVSVSYSIDDNIFTQTYIDLGRPAAGDKTSVQSFVPSGPMPAYKKIMFKITILPNTSTATPLIRTVMHRYKQRESQRKAWALQLLLEEGQMNANRSKDHRTSQKMLQHLNEARDKQQLVEFVDLVNDVYQVYVEQVGESLKAARASGIVSFVAKVVLVEPLELT